MMISRLALNLVAALLLMLACSAPIGSHPDGPYRPDLYPGSVWCSTGDFIDEYACMPMDSPATIASSFDCFKSYFHADRIFWRDAHVEWYKTFCIFRPESRRYQFWEFWANHDEQTEATSRAQAAARARGMEFWGTMPLFDIAGGPASAQGIQGYGPFFLDDPLRQYDPKQSIYVTLAISDDNQTVRYYNANRQLAYSLDPDNVGAVRGASLGICVGPDANGDGIGEIYIAGYYSANICRYDGRTGEFLSTFVGSGSGGISRIMGIAFGPDGNLYAVSHLEGSVYRFNGTTGACMGTFITGKNLPTAFSWGPNGHLYLATKGDNRIWEYTASVSIVRVLDPLGTAPLSEPIGICFGPDGRLYVSSSGNNRILRYDASTGNYVDTFVQPGNGGLSAPCGIAFGPDVNGDGFSELFVSSSGNNKILKYNGATGAFYDEYVSTSLSPLGLAFSQPRYAATDKMGISSIPGTLEYAYPAVRQEYVRRFNTMFNPINGPYRFYDGIQFYTYVENMCPRFDDEYIYLEAVDKEYLRRYAIDPRSAQVDLVKYNSIRGEYLTQLLRELRPVFTSRHKKLAITLDAWNLDQPCRWGCAGPPYTLPTGRINMDWQTWVKEGLVDEFTIWLGDPALTSDEITAINASIDEVQSYIVENAPHPISLSIRADHLPIELKHILDEGIKPVYSEMVASAGYPSTAPANYTPVPVDIDSTDPMKVLAVLYECIEVAFGRSTMTLPSVRSVTSKLNDSNPNIRRMAVNALAYCHMSGAEAALRNRLSVEPEVYVKALIICNLGIAGIVTTDPTNVNAIAEALHADPNYPMTKAAKDAFNYMPSDRFSNISALYSTYSGTSEGDKAVRRAVVMSNLIAKHPTDAFSLLRTAGLYDPDWIVRFEASPWIASYETYDSFNTFNTLYAMLDDATAVVSSRASLDLGSAIGTSEQIGLASTKLRDMFFQYGIGSQRADKEYGWKSVGNTLMQCGQTGYGYMVDILNDRSNKYLGGLAWQVLFTNDNGQWDPRNPEEVMHQYTYYPVEEKKYCINCTVTLKDIQDSDRVFSLVIRIKQNGIEKGAQTFLIRNQGSFALPNVSPGIYDVVCEVMPHWLRKVVRDVSVGYGNISITIPPLNNGDIDGDNGVDEMDYALLSNAWYKAAGDPAYNADSDLNGDGGVDEIDYAILSNTWYTAGD